MKKTPQSPSRTAPQSARSARPLFAVFATLGIASALLFGLSRIGDEARRNIGPRDRYAVRFADIQCETPPGAPGLTREAFLAEVRYVSNTGTTIQSLDNELQTTLTSAFTAHPWVAGVDAVTVEPPNAVAVKLTFRQPVLAVPTPRGKRAVDTKGILLPANAITDGLPELLTPVKLPPDAQAGQVWPDEIVVRGAPVAAEYKPRTLERTGQGWQLLLANGSKLVVGR